MKSKLKWIIGLSAILLLVTIALVLKLKDSEKSNKVDYATYTVKKEKPLNLEGKASPNAVKIYQNSRQIGTYLGIQVEDGQTVKQGDLLINYSVNNNQRQQIVNKVNEFQKSVNDSYRAINQNSQNPNLQKQLIQTQQSLVDAQQQLNQHDNYIKDNTYAEFDGKVIVKNTENIRDGQPILQLVSQKSQIQTTISEFDLNKIRQGDRVNITVINNGKTTKGKIKQISELPKSFESKMNDLNHINTQSLGDREKDKALDTSVTSNDLLSSNTETSKYTVIIDDIDIPIRAGYSLDIEVPLNIIKLPKSVLTKDNDVFVVDKNNKVKRLDIRIDKINGEIFVKKGLKEGDKVIKNPNSTLNDGDRIEVSS